MNSLNDYIIDYSLVDISKVMKYKVIPIRKQELSILVATTKDKINEKLEFIFNEPVQFISFSEQEINQELLHIETKKELYELSVYSINNINDSSENSFIIRFMEMLFSFCILHNVSDIHFESAYKSIVIRLRIDGDLIQFFRFEIKLFPLISSIIKYFGNLDISQKRIPLNGRFTHLVNNKFYDMRISTIPTIYGESIVLRILDNGNIKRDIHNIGFEENTLITIKKNLLLNQGLILVTGPTGSGKTTSLYSMINLLNTNNKKIITIEDPVEYKIDGVMQVNINNEINLNYQVVLKNILRQDPDILLIGEIRDLESLEIAIQASLTGHLVIATLHTNNALETITRLKDLKAEPYLIASTLKMVLSQRLLRSICSFCENQKGCNRCNYKGYKNRQVISEVLEIDQHISELISKEVPLYKIEEYLKKIKFRKLKDNGMDLVNSGKTTLEELYSKI